MLRDRCPIWKYEWTIERLGERGNDRWRGQHHVPGPSLAECVPWPSGHTVWRAAASRLYRETIPRAVGVDRQNTKHRQPILLAKSTASAPGDGDQEKQYGIAAQQGLSCQLIRIEPDLASAVVRFSSGGRKDLNMTPTLWQPDRSVEPNPWPHSSMITAIGRGLSGRCLQT